MKKFLIVSLTITAFFSVMMLAEAGMRKPGTVAPTGRSIYKRRGAVATTQKPTTPATGRYGTATTNQADSMNKEIPARRY